MTPAVASRQDAAPPETVTEGDAQYAIDLVGRICREVGPGVPGTPQERKRAEIIRRELERSLGPENVVGEEFTFAPGACLRDARDLNLEMIAHPEITILTSEKSGTVKNSPAMVQSVVAAAERAAVPFKLKAAVIGEANEAGSFSLAGLTATTLIPFKMPQQMVASYHQKWDRPEVLTTEPLLNVLKVAVEWLRHGGD